jgi:hypothetical protein
MIDAPTRSERDYLAAFGAVAIYRAAMPAGSPVKIGVARGLSKRRTRVSTDARSPTLRSAFWVRDRRSAELIVRDVCRAVSHRDGWLNGSVDYVTAIITDTAAKRGIVLTPHDRALARVTNATIHIYTVIEQANASGALKWFSEAYRAFRLNTDQSLLYQQSRARIRTAMVRCIADGREPGPGLCAEVFEGYGGPQAVQDALESSGRYRRRPGF